MKLNYPEYGTWKNSFIENRLSCSGKIYFPAIVGKVSQPEEIACIKAQSRQMK